MLTDLVAGWTVWCTVYMWWHGPTAGPLIRLTGEYRCTDRPGPVRTSAVRPPATAGANGDTQPTGLNSYIAPHRIRFLTSQHSHNLLANFQVRLFPPIPDFIIDCKWLELGLAVQCMLDEPECVSQSCYRCANKEPRQEPEQLHCRVGCVETA